MRNVGVRHRGVDVHGLSEISEAGAEDDAGARLDLRARADCVRRAANFFEQSVQGVAFVEKIQAPDNSKRAGRMTPAKAGTESRASRETKRPAIRSRAVFMPTLNNCSAGGPILRVAHDVLQVATELIHVPLRRR